MKLEYNLTEVFIMAAAAKENDVNIMENDKPVVPSIEYLDLMEDLMMELDEGPGYYPCR